MKIEAKFYSEKNELHFLDGSRAETGADKIYGRNVKWSEVGLDEDSYNEEFLAGLREELKLLEEKNEFCFIAPECDSECESQSAKESFVASMKHCARRIKDCENVIGFAIPNEVEPSFFMEELSAKHKHYIYFTRDAKLAQSNEEIVKY